MGNKVFLFPSEWGNRRGDRRGKGCSPLRAYLTNPSPEVFQASVRHILLNPINITGKEKCFLKRESELIFKTKFHSYVLLSPHSSVKQKPPIPRSLGPSYLLCQVHLRSISAPTGTELSATSFLAALAGTGRNLSRWSLLCIGRCAFQNANFKMPLPGLGFTTYSWVPQAWCSSHAYLQLLSCSPYVLFLP